MRLQIVQDALKTKNIKYEYTEEDGCGSLDFMFRGLVFSVGSVLTFPYGPRHRAPLRPVRDISEECPHSDISVP